MHQSTVKLLSLFLFLIIGLPAMCQVIPYSEISIENCDEEKSTDCPIFLVQEKPPFLGESATHFPEWVCQHVVYPETAKIDKIHGKVYLSCVIDTDGSITDVKVIRGIDAVLDEEAVCAVKSSPKWTPGRHNGQPVRVTYSLVVNFSMTPEEFFDKLSDLEKEHLKGSINGHEWIDLGLSVKWSSCNLGSNSPEGFGGYYAWGETETKDEYDWTSLKYCDHWEGGIFSKYKEERNLLDYLELERTDDAAATVWGSAWHTPTKEEWAELYKKCIWTWVSDGDVAGYKVTGSTGQSIFLPAAGCKENYSLRNTNTYGNYWSASLDVDEIRYAHFLCFSSKTRYISSSSRFGGFSIRPVTGPVQTY